MERQTRIVYPKVEINALITQFDKAGRRKKEGLAQRIVTHATEETFDWLTILKAVDIGLSTCLSHNDRPYGQMIVDGIEQFLVNRGLSFKYLVPPDIDTENAIKQFDTLIGENQKKIHTLSIRHLFYTDNVRDLFSSMDYAVESAKAALKKDPEAIGKLVPNFTANAEHLKNIHGRVLYKDRKVQYVPGVVYAESKQTYAAIFNAMSGYNVHPEEGRIMKVPETILEIAKSQINIREKGIPHIMTVKYNGVSLEDIFTAKIGSPEDMDRLCIMTMKYIGGIPKGDVFWNELMLGTFLVPQASRIDVDPKTFFKNPSIFERIYLIQQRMAEKLLMPALFTTELKDEEFDREFIDMISRSDLVIGHNLGVIIRGAVVRGPITIAMLSPHISVTDAIRLTALSRIALDHYQGKRQGFHMAGAEELGHVLLKDNRNRIIENWKVRFFANYKKMKYFEEGFQLGLDEEYESAEGHTRKFIHDITTWLGESFFEKLQTRGEELSQVVQDFYADIRDQKIDYWPDPQVLTEIEFPDGSLARIMGFNSIVIGINETDEHIVEFMLNTKNKNLSLWGTVDVRTAETNFSANLESYVGLKFLISGIIGSNFHDLIWREKIVKKRRQAAKEKKEGVSLGSTEGQKEKRTPKKSLAKLPKQRVRYEGQRIKREIHMDLREKNITPRHVPRHKTRLQYSYPYEAAVERYNRESATGGLTENAEIIRELTEARERLRSPSEEKARSLPPGFALATIKDPVTGDEYCIETWVVKYWAPKPNEAELKSPVLMYQHHFKGNAATTDFIDDYVGSWIVESAILETPSIQNNKPWDKNIR